MFCAYEALLSKEGIFIYREMPHIGLLALNWFIIRGKCCCLIWSLLSKGIQMLWWGFHIAALVFCNISMAGKAWKFCQNAIETNTQKVYLSVILCFWESCLNPVCQGHFLLGESEEERMFGGLVMKLWDTIFWILAGICLTSGNILYLLTLSLLLSWALWNLVEVPFAFFAAALFC